MSYLIRRPSYLISRRQFDDLPEIPNVTPALRQAQASEAGLSFSESGAATTPPVFTPGEGCLVTGVIDYALKKTHMLSPIRNGKRQAAKKDVEAFLRNYLAVVPEDFHLDHLSNLTWLMPQLHAHHDRYATISICPSLHDLEILAQGVEDDNTLRWRFMEQNPGHHVSRYLQPILGRPELKHEYELIVLWPQHFLVQGPPLIVKDSDGQFHQYYTAPDHRLHRTSDITGPALLPFSRPGYRTGTDRLNPFLVYLAANIRIRRLRRVCQIPKDSHIEQLIKAMDRLHDALMAFPSESEDTFSKRLTPEGQRAGGRSGPHGKKPANADSPRRSSRDSPPQAHEADALRRGQGESHQLGFGRTGQSIGNYFLDLMTPRFEEPWKDEEMAARARSPVPDPAEKVRDCVSSSGHAA